MLAIDTREELQRALTMQRTATAKTIMELHGALTGDGTSPEVMAEQVLRLLASYAVLPTLHEYETSMPLRGAFKPGTFGVALIAGEMLLKPVQEVASSFPRAHLMLLIHLLSKLRPGLDPLELLADEITLSLKAGLTAAEHRRLSLERLGSLASALMNVCETYKLIDTAGPCDSAITPLGQRVALHLLDAYEFVNIVVDAHQRLQP